MAQYPSRDPEPIAIIGIGCRMPGGVRSPKDFWELMMDRRIGNSVKVPSSRFNIDAYLHPNNGRPGSFNVSGGYFLEEDVRAFDPGMFNISPIEALWMDPQQKKLLEVVYETFENSGTKLEDVSGKNIGCFVGNFTVDYHIMSSRETDFKHPYVATGVDTGILANRLSYVFNLKGPSLTINTACSSSLYAVDIACKTIASGGCDAAIVGGTNLILTVEQQMNTAKLGVLSPTNQSRPFDEGADGYGRAETVGALYLKPLSAAIRDGDPIRSVILSTATSSNGRFEEGIVHPSIEGQKAVISLAYELGRLKAEDTSYVECHGTGTKVGDPIEVRAIHESMGSIRSQTNPVLIGSVIKPNVGHSEAASSMATLIKATLALEKNMIPPTVGITKLSSNIPWHDLNVKVVTEPTPFPQSSPHRRIGVSAYGYGGTNAHAILESHESASPNYRGHKFLSQHQVYYDVSKCDERIADRPHLLLFSAHDEPTLRNNLGDYSTHCKQANTVDLAYTLGVRRSKFSQRTYTIGHQETLESDIVAAGATIASSNGKTGTPAFVFTGQGAQWPRMGATLLELFPSFLKTIRRLDLDLSKLTNAPSWKIESVITDRVETSLVNEPEYSQPICTAIQIALVDLLAQWGVKPAATIGHSSGEIAAAYAAGLISSRSAIIAAYFRGKVAALLQTDGAMLAVGLGAGEASKYIDKEPYMGKIVIACRNSQKSTTLSGDREAIQRLKNVFDDETVFARVLKTGGKAYHSHHMRDASILYQKYLEAESDLVEIRGPKIPMFSTVTAQPVSGGELPDTYWATNLHSPVLFDEGVQRMLRDMPHITVLVEVGPHSALSGPLRQICQSIDKASMTYLPTLKRTEHDGEQMLRLAGGLWVKGVPINTQAVTSVEEMSKDGAIVVKTGSLLVDLPPYHWTYTKTSLAEPRASKEHREMKWARHDILGRRVEGLSSLDFVWKNTLRQKDLPWLVQHKLGGEVMLPATGYIALAIEALTQINEESKEPLDISSYTLRNVAFSNAIVVPDDDGGTETMFHIRSTDDRFSTTNNQSSRLYQFTASSCSYGSWSEAASGYISLNIKDQTSMRDNQGLPSMTNHSYNIDWLNKMRTVGVDLGPAFHRIGDMYSDGESYAAKGTMTISRSCGLMEAESRYPSVVALYRGRLHDVRCGLIPTHSDQLANQCTVQLWSPGPGNRALTSDIQLIGHDGLPLVEITGFRGLLYRAAIPRPMQGNLQRDLYLKLDWQIDSTYFEWANNAGALSDRPLATAVAALLHKDPYTRILCLDDSLLASIVSILPGAKVRVITSSQERQDFLEDQYSEISTLEIANLNDEQTDIELSESKGKYGLVLASTTNAIKPQKLEHIRGTMASNGRLLLSITNGSYEDWEPALRSAGFRGDMLMLPENLVLIAAAEPILAMNGTYPTKRNILLVYRDNISTLCRIASNKLTQEGWDVRCQEIGSSNYILGEQVILLADNEEPLLAHLKGYELESLIQLTEKATKIIWVTPGGLLTGDIPEYAMAIGAVRTIRREKASLDLVTVDFDADTTSEDLISELIADIAARQLMNGRNGETEYCVKNGVVYVGRIVPHRSLLRDFVIDSGETTAVYQQDETAVRAEFENGKIIFRRDDRRVDEPLGDNDVEVRIAAIGLTVDDGADDTNFLNHEMAGTITRVGSEVRNVTPGTDIMGFACDKLATFQRTSSDLVQPLPRGSSLTDTATLPSAFSTAIYGLEELARLEQGDYVVIIDGMGAVGLAALQLCQISKANAIVVTSSATTNRFLRETERLPRESIIFTQTDNLSLKLKRATGGHGIDIIFCSTTTDATLASESSQALAAFGRVVEFGRTNNGRSALPPVWSHTQNISYFNFDSVNMLAGRRRPLARSLERCAELYKDGRIRPLAIARTGRPSEVNKLYQSIPTAMGSGKLIIAYGKGTSFEVSPSPSPLKFKSDVTYLLVGCLGGIGRSVALWMVERGAKHLAFVSRNGTDKKAAAQTVLFLRDKGVDVLVLRADIANKAALADAVAKIDPAIPIRGMVNAAGVLHDVLFQNMTISAWHEVVQPKVKGNLNLHEVLKDTPLDFFVMTSSVSATLESSGQTNYSAANSVLDSLACHRHARGLPAISLILPAILDTGYIAENPEVAQMIKLKGMYGIYEREMLEAFEVAMRPKASLPADTHHIIVGIQPRRFKPALDAAGTHPYWKDDARLSWLAMKMQEEDSEIDIDSKVKNGSSDNILAAIQHDASADHAIRTLATYLSQRVARLLMIDGESMQLEQKSVASYGLDSMIGAEFRNWISHEFKIDVPFQQLLAGNLTLSELAKMLYEKVKLR
ncbi:ketoacyl-synt-domain-containing protein [Annulohypoxylon moriforme]|nr:ketoacyl-synt-domain-containing protein [Annulohypoxylon moriforme]